MQAIVGIYMLTNKSKEKKIGTKQVGDDFETSHHHH